MMNAPKKIWVYPYNMESSDNDWVSTEPVLDGDVPYIRADLVDGLVIALKHWFSSHSDWDQMEVEVKAALKALEEE
jgi:hypothetical protein